jgi:hypothetical protein
LGISPQEHLLIMSPDENGTLVIKLVLMLHLRVVNNDLLCIILLKLQQQLPELEDSLELLIVLKKTIQIT